MTICCFFLSPFVGLFVHLICVFWYIVSLDSGTTGGGGLAHTSGLISSAGDLEWSNVTRSWAVATIQSNMRFFFKKKDISNMLQKHPDRSSS